MNSDAYLAIVAKANPNLTLLEIYDLAKVALERHIKVEDSQVTEFLKQNKHLQIDFNNENLPKMFKRWKLNHPDSTIDDVTASEDSEMTDQKNPADSSQSTLQRVQRTTFENFMSITHDLSNITETSPSRIMSRIQNGMDALSVHIAAIGQLAVEPSQLIQVQNIVEEVQVKLKDFLARVSQTQNQRNNDYPYDDYDFRKQMSVLERRTYARNYHTVPELWEAWTVGFDKEDDSIYKVNRYQESSKKGSLKERKRYRKRYIIAMRIKKIAEERKISLKEAAEVVEQNRVFPEPMSLNALSKKILYEDKPIY